MKVLLHENPARPTTNLQRTEYFADSLLESAFLASFKGENF